MLKLNTAARTSQLPISIYESMIEIEEGTTKVLYSPISYTLATEEAERIGVDHIARVSVAGSKESSAGMCECVSKKLFNNFLFLLLFLFSIAFSMVGGPSGIGSEPVIVLRWF